MIGDRIHVTYSCACGLAERQVLVPARAGEPLVEWLDNVVMPLVGTDHRHTSPLCRSTKVQDVRFHVSGIGS